MRPDKLFTRNIHNADETEEEIYTFKVLSTEQILQDMKYIIEEVRMETKIPAPMIRIILNHFQWNKHLVLEILREDGEDSLLGEVHIVNPYNIPSEKSANSATEVNEECKICCSDIPSKMVGLHCGHQFCEDCWREYLTTQIMQEGRGHTIACAAHNCDVLVDYDSVMKILETEDVKVKYLHLIANSFVICKDMITWCSNANCSYAIKVESPKNRPVKCQCGHTFCFLCGEIPHEPVSCNLLKKWRKRCDFELNKGNHLDTDTVLERTKECPKCSVALEKIRGCNHMKCKMEGCNHHFCWECLKDWKLHKNTYRCKFVNNLEDDEEDNAPNTEEDQTLEDFTLHYDKYMTHTKYLNTQQRLYKKIYSEKSTLRKNKICYHDLKRLKPAVDILFQCCRTLMFANVFAFYLKKDNNHSILFEQNLIDLENSEHDLSDLLEGDIKPDNWDQNKQKIVDKSLYCNQSRKNVINYINEGYNNGWWQ